MNRGSILILSAVTMLGLQGCESAATSTAAPNSTAARDLTTPTGGESCQTAFAYGAGSSTCFSQITGTPRWGWSIGPIAEGVSQYDIYAGAGQCDLGKGTKVGQVSLHYVGGVAKVGIQMFAGYTMSESHLYLGSEPLPRAVGGKFTVAPGQYPYSHDLQAAQSDSFTVSGLSGDLKMVLHMVSCPRGSVDSSGKSGGSDKLPGADTSNGHSGKGKSEPVIVPDTVNHFPVG